MCCPSAQALRPCGCSTHPTSGLRPGRVATMSRLLGYNDAVLIVSLSLSSIDLLCEWSAFQGCAKPIHAWLVVSYAFVVAVRTAHLFGAHLAKSQARPRLGVSEPRQDGWPHGKFLPALSRCCQATTNLGLVPTNSGVNCPTSGRFRLSLVCTAVGPGSTKCGATTGLGPKFAEFRRLAPHSPRSGPTRRGPARHAHSGPATKNTFANSDARRATWRCKPSSHSRLAGESLRDQPPKYPTLPLRQHRS